MEKNTNPIAPRIAFLMEGYFAETLTGAEDEELDEWVAASIDNQRIFESYLEIRRYNKQPGNDDEVFRTLQYTAALIVRFLKGTITTDEQNYLNEWADISPFNAALLDSLPASADMEYLCNQLRLRLMRQQYGQQLN